MAKSGVALGTLIVVVVFAVWCFQVGDQMKADAHADAVLPAKNGGITITLEAVLPRRALQLIHDSIDCCACSCSCKIPDCYCCHA